MPASGSTGQPKGVLVPHHSVSQALLAHQTVIPHFSRFLQFASPTFDVSIFEIFFPWFRGATLVACRRNTLLNGLIETINALNIDGAELTPTVASSLLQARHQVPKLKVLMTIGETLTRYVINEYGSSADSWGILQGMYGPTEAAIHCTVLDNVQSHCRAGLVGRPLRTVSTYVKALSPDSTEDSKRRDLMPVGQVGELVIGGHQLAKGYLNRPEATAKAFVEDAEHGQLYRTGDMARQLPDGSLEFLGRVQSGQVKLRGQRVELGEIEAAAMQTKGCPLAVATIISGNLVLFFMGVNIKNVKVRTSCEKWLPRFMIPNDFIRLDDIPRLPSGKVNRNALEKLYANTQAESDQPDISVNESERSFKTMIEDLIGKTDRIGPSRDVGLDSISAIQLASRLRSHGYFVDAVELIRAGTYRAITALLQGREKQHSREESTLNGDNHFSALASQVIDRPGMLCYKELVQDVYPCTPLQASMLAETWKNGRAYCNYVEFSLKCNASLDAITSAFINLAFRNEILRSGFIATEESATGFAQIVWTALDRNQIVNKESLTYDFSLTQMDHFMRPLRTQVVTKGATTTVLLQLHHALYDGWSIDLLVRDLDTILGGGELNPRPQFSDVIRFYDALNGSDSHHQANRYWTSQMKDYQPTQFPNLSGLTHSRSRQKCATLEIPFDTTRASTLSQLSLHPQVLFQAAYAYLLAAYTGNSDVAFGLVTSGRTVPVAGIENVLGPCLVTLPTRVNSVFESIPEALLAELKNLNQELMEFCTTSLTEIKRLCEVPPQTALFDTLLVWQESLLTKTFKPSNIEVTDGEDFLEFKLVLELTPLEHSIKVVARYQDGVIPTAHIDVFLGQFKAIAESLFTNTESHPLAGHCPMTESLLSVENPAFAIPHIDSSLTDRVEQFAESDPNRSAVEIANILDNKLEVVDRLTYCHLNARANRLGWKLLDNGVKPDDLVCIFMEKSLDLYASILAALKTGAGYMALTPATPLNRIETILRDAQVKTCLVQSTSPSHIRTIPGVSTIENDSHSLDQYSSANLERSFIGSDLAYAVFTSGSTGTPKGVLVTQKNLASNINVLSDIYPVGSDPRLLQACSQAFDVSVFEIFFAWHSGMCLCSGTNDVLFHNFEKTINELRITHLSLTPTVAALADPVEVPGVKFLVTSGEAVTDVVFEKWAGKGLHIGYGPSETTNICSVNPKAAPTVRKENVGPPLKNTSAFVLKSDSKKFEVLPRGAIGELAFGGEQVFRGYLNSPELNSAKIFHHAKFGKVYRSGDVGRILHDGSMIVLGRLDDQIKLRGQRIELGEITSVISRTNLVQDCVVLSAPSSESGDALVGFWVPKSKSTSTELHLFPPDGSYQGLNKQLYQTLTDSLPTYMIPTALLPISTIPITSQSKTDKRKLMGLWENIDVEVRNQYVNYVDEESSEDAWTPLERQVREQVAEAVKIPMTRVNRSTSLFALGVDSFSAIHIARVLQKQIGSQLLVSDILRGVSIQGLASRIERKSRQGSSVPSPHRQTFENGWVQTTQNDFASKGLQVEHLLPCTPLQEGMLLASASSNSSDYYNHTLFEVDCSTDEIFEYICVLCQRHEILRTCFVTTAHQRFAFAQVVLHQHIPNWNVISTSENDLIKKATRGLKCLGAVDTFERPFAVTAIKSKGKTFLSWLMHHALYDGVAIDRLYIEFEQLFFKQHLPAPVPFAPFLDHSLSLDLQDADRFWSRQFEGFIPIPSPTLTNGNNRNSGKTRCSSVVTHFLKTSLSSLEEASRERAVTVQSLLQAALVYTIAAFSGENDICFGTVVSGRTLTIDDVHLERLVAPCFNTVPVRLCFRHGEPVGHLLQRLQDFNANSLDYQFTPLRRIQSKLTSNGQPLFDNLFLLQAPPHQLDKRLWTLKHESGDMGYPFVWEFVPDPMSDSVCLRFHHDQSYVNSTGAQHLVEAIDECLELNILQSHRALEEMKLSYLRQYVLERRHIRFSGNCFLGCHNLCETLQRGNPEVENMALIEHRTNIAASPLVFIQLDSRSAQNAAPAVKSKIEKELRRLTGSPYQLAEQIIIVEDIPLSDSSRPSPSALMRLHLESKSSKAATEEAHRSTKSPDTKENQLVRDVLAHYSSVPAQQISLNKSIYQLGLDSINAIQIARELKSKGYEVSAQTIIESHTGASLVSYLSSSGKKLLDEEDSLSFASLDEKFKDSLCSQLQIESSHVEVARPCTPTQAGMLAQSLHSHGMQYINHSVYELPAAFDTTSLHQAWNAAMKKFEMLRTGFASIESQEYSFAMVCYRLERIEVPWTEEQVMEDPFQHLLALRDSISTRILHHFHAPAWKVTVAKSETRCLFQFSAHHALYDAASLQMIIEEVESRLCGRELDSRPSFDSLLNKMIEASKDSNGSSRAFWREHLQRAPELSFPTLTTNIETATVGSTSLPSSMSGKTIADACKKLDTSVQAVLQACWATLLSAYLGESQISFGVVLSGREIDNADDICFPTAVTVPFACSVVDDKHEMLRNIMSFNASVRKHQYLPLTDIRRAAGRSTLFDTLFVLQRRQMQKTDAIIRDIDQNSTVEYPISLEIDQSHDFNITFRLVFREEILPAGQASIMLRQTDDILSALLQGPDHVRLSSLSPRNLAYLPPRRTLMKSSVDTLHGLVEAQAKKKPSQIALEFVEDLQLNRKYFWSYHDLNLQGNKYANFILRQKVERGSIIAICFDKCPDASFVILGILKAGCAYVALDPTAPQARKDFIINDSKVKIVFTHSAIFEELKHLDAELVVNVDHLDRTSLGTTNVLLGSIDPESTSYCLYTSGSTGTPKGCLISHKNAVQLILVFQNIFAGRWDSDSRWLQFASFHFDVSVMEQFWSWSVGIRLVSAPRDVIFEDLCGALRQLEITHIDLTPTLARLISPEDVPSLCKGVFITGGESLRLEVLDAWGDKGVIHNGYGPTECTIGVTMYPRVPKNGRPSNIGWQFDNVGTSVLKPGTNEVVLRGGVGELCIFGNLVGKGYLNRQELTEERFPFLDSFNTRIYRTGDLVRLLSDESFDFLGRVDDQVKLRGQRLELGEINNVIMNSSSRITDCIALPLEHPQQGNKHLIGFPVVANSGQLNGSSGHIVSDSALADKVISACQRKLPTYMVPTSIVLLSRLPLSPNNKVDKIRLQEIFNGSLIPTDRPISDSKNLKSDHLDETECEIVAVMKKVFPETDLDLGRSTNLFQAGLDSISVFRFVNILKAVGFRKAQTQLVMRTKTIQDLANSLRKDDRSESVSVEAAKRIMAVCHQRHLGSVASTMDVSPDEIEYVAPCTPLQQGMIARSLTSGTHMYFNDLRFELGKSVDLHKLQVAWNSLVDAIPILRTRFVPIEDGHVQVALRQSGSVTTQKCVKNNQECWRQAQDDLQEWCQSYDSFISRPFEVSFYYSGECTYMVIRAFHGIYDAISLDLILRRCLDGYASHNNLEEAPAFFEALPHGPLAEVADSETFWRTHLSPAQNKMLKSMSKEQHEDGGCNHCEVSIQDLHGLDTVRKELGVTHQAMMQACWILTLDNYLKSPTVIGLVVSGRAVNLGGVDKTIGPLFNTIPFYLRPEARDTFASLARNCHDFNINAMQYQHTPSRDIQKWIPNQGQPLFDTLFVFQKSEDGLSCRNNDVWKEVEQAPKADFPLAVEVEQTGGDSLNLTIVARKNVISNEQCRSLIDGVRNVLLKMLQNSQQPLREALGDDIEQVFNACGESDGSTPNNAGHDEDTFVWTEQAEIVRDAICHVANLHEDQVTGNTSIFEIGFDSVDAIKLSSKLKRMGFNLSVGSIMKSPSIGQMSSLLDTRESSETSEHERKRFESLIQKARNAIPREVVDASKIEQILPATPLQESMVAEMESSACRNYLNHDVLKLNTQVDIQALHRAWSTAARKLPILRTCFMELADTNLEAIYAQAITKDTSLRWTDKTFDSHKIDFDAITEDQRLDVLQGDRLEPPLRFTLLHNPRGNFLVISIAHALYDGFSLSLIHDAVRRAYRNMDISSPSYEGSLQKIFLASNKEAEQYWRSAMRDAQTCMIPLRSDRAPTASDKVHRKEVISRSSLENLSSFCKSHSITLQTLGQACWSCVLASYARKLDVVFGVVLSGRDDEESQRVVFPTMNTVAVRSVLHGTRVDMLRYLQATSADILQHQHFPLRKIQALAGPKGQKLFNSLFIFQKRPDGEEDVDSLYESVESASAVDYPVCVEMEVMDGKLVLRTACEDQYLSDEDTTELLERLDTVLEEFVANPREPTIKTTENKINVCNLPTFLELKPSVSNDNPSAPSDSEALQTNDGPSAWTQTEQALRTVLAKSSQLPETSITKSQTIFHLGFDSISAIKISSLLRKEQGLSVTVGEMMRAQTIEGIASVADRKKGRQQGRESSELLPKSRQELATVMQEFDVKEISRRVGVDSEDVEAVLPASPGQCYMLSLWHNSRGELFYPRFRYRIRGLSIGGREATLRSAWRDLVSSTPVLRTAFISTGRFDIPLIQLTVRNSQSHLHIDNDRKNPVDTETTSESATIRPMVTATLRQTPNPDTPDLYLDLHIHHALYDAVSLRLLASTFQDLCNGTNRSLPLQSTADTTFDLLAQTYAPSSQDALQSFWTRYLSDAPKAPIRPFHTAEPGPQPPKTDANLYVPRTEFYKPTAMPPQTYTAVARSLRHHGLTIHALFLAAVAVALCSYPQRHSSSSASPAANESNEDVIIALYTSNRSSASLSHLPNPTLNVIPLRVRAPSTTPLTQLAREVQTDLAEITNAESGQSGVGLWEVYNWTGVSVGCVVNFLVDDGERDVEGRAEQTSKSDNEDTAGGVVRISQEDLDRSEVETVVAAAKQSEQGKAQTTNAERQLALLEPPESGTSQQYHEHMKAAYPPTLDIEAAVRRPHSIDNDNDTDDTTGGQQSALRGIGLGLDVGVFSPRWILAGDRASDEQGGGDVSGDDNGGGMDDADAKARGFVERLVGIVASGARMNE
ncbi:MAG: NRPS [Alyxoria varia]|nr:MAG: NRPS [Alyxoria varia]